MYYIIIKTIKIKCPLRRRSEMFFVNKEKACNKKRTEGITEIIFAVLQHELWK